MAVAASNSRSEVCSNYNDIQMIAAQFFQMIPVRRIKWKGQMIDSDNIGVSEQLAVLNATVLSSLCQQYAPSLSYRRAFMKQVIQKLEEMDAEICDEIYETYTDLLQQQDVDEDDTLCHKSYFLPNEETLSLQESVHLISQGTTGLSTWQAALHLAEWSFENKEEFENRRVLELGSGLGLTGLAICKHCNPKSFVFSDCHPQVLYLLMKNIEINLLKNVCSLDRTFPMPSTKHGTEDQKILKNIQWQLSMNSETIKDDSSDIMEISCSSMLSSDSIEEGLCHYDGFVPNSQSWNTTEWKGVYHLKAKENIWLMNLDWESSYYRTCVEAADPDIIVAADVVYDKSIIPALVQVLQSLLTKENRCGPKPVAYVASTIRNEDTRDFFLIVLGNEGLAYDVVEPPKQKLFFYDDIIPIEILRIYHPSKQ